MLQRNTDHHHRFNGYDRRLPAPAAAEPHGENELAVLFNIIACLRRNLKLIIAIALAGTAVATVAVFMMTPKYVATVTVLVDPRQTKILQDAEVVSQLKVDSRDAGGIDSEVELMTSDTVMRQVARRLNLKDDDEFGGSGGLVTQIKRLVLLPFRLLGSSQGPEDELAPVVGELSRNVSTKRRGSTYVIDLNIWSRDPAKAARIANAFGEAYLDDQRNAKASATRQASEWLNQRVEELRDRVIASERALEQYRAEAGLSSVYRTSLEPGGQRIADQQVAKLSEQLIDARSKAAQAEAKYNQLKQITPDKLRSAAASVDVLQSTVVSNLRVQYAEASRYHAERAARYGREHPHVVNARAHVVDLERQIAAEIDRIVGSARTEAEMAKSREASLTASLDQLKQRASEADQASIRLHELQREVETNQEVYKAVLARAKQTAQLDMQIADSRIVSAASVPTRPAFPRKGLLIGFGFVGSLGLGIGLVLVREMFNRGFRRAVEIEQTLGLQPLASIPRMGDFRHPAADRVQPLGSNAVLRLAGPSAAGRATREPPRRRSRSLGSVVLDQPGSAFAESIRTLYFGLRQQAGGSRIGVVMVTSALPGEGKSTVAVNLARIAAQFGSHVLLVDGDLRRPSVATSMDINTGMGLADLLDGTADFQSCVWQDERSGLHVIGGTRHLAGTQSLRLLSSPRTKQLIDRAREAFDLVVVDSSPLSPVADSRVLINLVDGAVLVVASERTSRETIAAVLRENPDVDNKIVGVVLNGSVEDTDHYYYDPGVIDATANTRERHAH